MKFGEEITELAEQLIETFGGSDRRQMELMLGVRLWHQLVEPGHRVAIEVPPDDNIVYGEILKPGAGDKSGRKKDLYDREAIIFEHPLLEDWRLAKVYKEKSTNGKIEIVHLSMIKSVLTEKGWDEARSRGWPNSFNFASSCVDEEWFKAVNDRLRKLQGAGR